MGFTDLSKSKLASIYLARYKNGIACWPRQRATKLPNGIVLYISNCCSLVNVFSILVAGRVAQRLPRTNADLQRDGRHSRVKDQKNAARRRRAFTAHSALAHQLVLVSADLHQGPVYSWTLQRVGIILARTPPCGNSRSSARRCRASLILAARSATRSSISLARRSSSPMTSESSPMLFFLFGERLPNSRSEVDVVADLGADVFDERQSLIKGLFDLVALGNLFLLFIDGGERVAHRTGRPPLIFRLCPRGRGCAGRGRRSACCGSRRRR